MPPFSSSHDRQNPSLSRDAGLQTASDLSGLARFAFISPVRDFLIVSCIQSSIPALRFAGGSLIPAHIAALRCIIRLGATSNITRTRVQ
ncbi:unnamed protein product, partial [Mycena citricolor]